MPLRQAFGEDQCELGNSPDAWLLMENGKFEVKNVKFGRKHTLKRPK
jgi:hypothetical protein